MPVRSFEPRCQGEFGSQRESVDLGDDEATLVGLSALLANQDIEPGDEGNRGHGGSHTQTCRYACSRLRSLSELRPCRPS